MVSSGISATPRAALCIGHPGHELRVLEWITRYRPLVSVLTDGSGADREPRIECTRQTLAEAGASTGEMFGAYSDRSFYDLMLAGDPAPFIAVAGKLADEWQRENIELVVGDMIEGSSTSHDVCRFVINAAIEHLSRARGRSIANYEFPLYEVATGDPPAGSIVIELERADYLRKRSLAWKRYPGMKLEVIRSMVMYGGKPFMTEVLSPAPSPAGLIWDKPGKPIYERYGAFRISRGKYRRLITYRDHLQPLAQALWNWACSGSPAVRTR